jgi:hypothetical protein
MTASLPPRRVLEIANRKRPRWGLRFFFLLILAGGAAYAARDWVPWIDTRVTYVENVVQEMRRQYGFFENTPAPLPRPSGTLPAASGGDVALARVPSRPDVQQMPSVAKSAVPAPARTPVATAAAARPTAAAPAPRAYGRRHAAAGSASRARWAARRRLAAARAAAAANRAAAKPAAPVAAAVAAPVAKPKPEAPAAAPPPAEPAQPAAKPAGGGDDLDQLMASAVGGNGKGGDLDKKLANVQKAPEKAAAAKNVAEIRQPLGRSEIQVVMKDVQNQMGDCLKKTGQGGPVDVKVQVAPDGDVTNTVISGPLAGTATGACVESKLKSTIFPPSTGQTFNYRLVVR